MAAYSKTILIAGNYGFGNAGDEAILAAMIADLRRQRTDLRLVVVSGSPLETRDVHDVVSIHWHDIPSIIESVRSCDLIVLGGGGLFFDYWEVGAQWQLSMHHTALAYYTEFALLSALLDKPLMIYAVGVGPLRSDEARALTRLAFEQAEVATVRDPASKALLESLGVHGARVTVTADPAFGFNLADDRPTLPFPVAPTGARRDDRPLLGVALRNWDVGSTGGDWEGSVAGALDAFVDAHGGTVVFVPLQKAEGHLTDDLAIAQRVSRRMRHVSQTSVLAAEHTVGEKAAWLRRCDLLLAMRLHAVILAAAGAVPAMALDYDPKVASTFARLGVSEFVVGLDALTTEDIVRTLNRVYEQRVAVAERIQQAAARLAGLARDNARLAVDLLDRGSPAEPKGSSPLLTARLKTLMITQALRNHHLQDTVSGLQREIAECRRSADSLQEQLTERYLAALALEGRVASLHAQLDAQTEAAGLAEAQAARKALEVQAMAAQLTEREHALQALAAEASHRLRAIAALTDELALIKSTRGWAWLERFRRVRAIVRRGST